MRYRQGPQTVYLEPNHLVRHERLTVPFEMALLGDALGLVLRVVGRLLWFSIRHWWLTTFARTGAWLWIVHGRLPFLIALLTLVTLATSAGCVWSYKAPERFAWHVTSRVRGAWWRLVRYERRWRDVMHGCGLLSLRDGAEYGPQISRVRSWPGRDVLTVRLAIGQTPDTVTKKCEALAHAFGVFRIDARTPKPGWVTLTVLRRDILATPVPVSQDVYSRDLARAHAAAAGSPEGVTELLNGVPVGVTEMAGPYRLPVRGTHVLIAGCTGSGKSGLEWALLRGLAPVIRSGYVSVTALDPKWMELAAARGLVEVITDVPTMPAALEDLVTEMDVRCRALEGTTRVHVPSRQAPHRVIVVDELATLTALADRRSRERVEVALGSLTVAGSRGRVHGRAHDDRADEGSRAVAGPARPTGGVPDGRGLPHRHGPRRRRPRPWRPLRPDRRHHPRGRVREDRRRPVPGPGPDHQHHRSRHRHLHHHRPRHHRGDRPRRCPERLDRGHPQRRDRWRCPVSAYTETGGVGVRAVLAVGGLGWLGWHLISPWVILGSALAALTVALVVLVVAYRRWRSELPWRHDVPRGVLVVHRERGERTCLGCGGKAKAVVQVAGHRVPVCGPCEAIALSRIVAGHVKGVHA